MAERNQQAPVQGTPEQTEAAPNGTQPQIDWESDENPYRQRYNDLRPEADRRATRLQELEQEAEIARALRDPERQAQALEALGLAFAEEEAEDDDFVDPYDELKQRFDKLEQRLSTRDQKEQAAQQWEAEVSFIDQSLEAIEKETGDQLDDDEARAVGTLSLQMRDEQGRPDVKQAYELIYNTILPRRKEKWVQNKRTAPQVSSGAPGQPEPNLDDPRERKAHIAEQLRIRREAAEGS